MGFLELIKYHKTSPKCHFYKVTYLIQKSYTPTIQKLCSDNAKATLRQCESYDPTMWKLCSDNAKAILRQCKSYDPTMWKLWSGNVKAMTLTLSVWSLNMAEFGIHLCCYTYWFTIQVIESFTETLYINIKTLLNFLT